jgi:hypothetical protein
LLNKSLKKQQAHAERRAAQLKEALSAKAAAHKALTEQVQALTFQRAGPSAQSSSVGLPNLFSEPSRSPAEAHAAATSPEAADSLPPARADVQALEVEVAKRETELERLQTALGKALDAQRGQAECFATLTSQAQQKEQVCVMLVVAASMLGAKSTRAMAQVCMRGHCAIYLSGYCINITCKRACKRKPVPIVHCNRCCCIVLHEVGPLRSIFLSCTRSSGAGYQPWKRQPLS